LMKEIIAECGPSWHDIEEAKKLITQCSEAGATAVKFQLYNIDKILAGPHKDKKWYMDTLKKYDKMLRKSQLTESMAKELVKHAQNKHMEIFFTPMYLEAVDICESFGVKRYKVRALDAYWPELLFKIRKTGKRCYVSRANLKFHDPLKQKNFFTVYYDLNLPTSYVDVMRGYSNLLKSDGYSCHCTKMYAPMQVMLFGGVDYIEIHIALDANDKTLPDWKYTHSPVDLLEIVNLANLLNLSVTRSTPRPKYAI